MYDGKKFIVKKEDILINYKNNMKPQAVKIKFKPLHDRVLIKPMEAATHTKAGIIIPETAQRNPPGGEIISAGNGITKLVIRIFGVEIFYAGAPLFVKKRDNVVYHKHSGEDISFDKETGYLVTPDTPAEQTVVYKTMREAEIIAIL